MYSIAELNQLHNNYKVGIAVISGIYAMKSIISAICLGHIINNGKATQ